MRTLLALLLLPAVAFAQKDATIPESDPEVERKSFIVAPGFEVTLFAADPVLAKPIQMNFDPQGRLWVATSETYPQILPGQVANDKIIILEDTTGTGRADKTTIFADGLLIPTGIEPGDGGAYVANSTELVHLSASKPGLKADRKRILLSGFGTEDTHHIIHTFRWGPEQALYFNQSIYIHSHVETPDGVKRLNAGGIWRFNPDTSGLGIFARGWVNAWGHCFDAFGQSFVTDGAGGQGINHVIPGSYYETASGPHAKRLAYGLNPGSPKHCAAEVISGRHFPDDWQGDLITHDFRGHRVCRFKLQEAGSTFASREQAEVLKTTHPAFRPIDVKMGPDGALYIADWYNPIIQHGEVDFRDPRRDKTHGRIWRVTAKDRALVPKPKIVGATVPELLQQLKAPEQWTRQQAKRVLKERGAEAVQEHLPDWFNKLPEDAEQTRLEGCWVMQACGVMDSGTIKKMLAAKDPRVRAGFVRLLSQMPIVPSTGELVRAVEDPSPLVRLEAIRALAMKPDAKSLPAALKALDQPMDKSLDYALWLTVRELEPAWLPEFKAGKLDLGDTKKLTFALSAIGGKDIVKPLVALAGNDSLPIAQRKQLWLLVATYGGPAELEKALQLGHVADDLPYTEALLMVIETSVRERKVGPPPNQGWGTLHDYAHVSDRPAIRHSALRLMGLWKIEAYRLQLEQRAENEEKDAGDRQAAFDGLVSLGGAKTKAFLMKQTDGLALAALAAIDPAAAIDKLLVMLADDKAALATRPVFDALIARKASLTALEKALAGKTITADGAKIGIRAVRASSQNLPGLVAALTTAGKLTAVKPPTADEVKTLAADALKLGDPARGEAVYRRKEMQCLVCHAIGGAGGIVGPDMTSVGASAQPDYLVESLLLPSKAIKEGYNSFDVTTLAGKTVSGIKVRESPTDLVLRIADGSEVTIRSADIDAKKDGRSLMPEGLTEPLTRPEFLDLVRFLSEVGKVGAYAPNTARLVRRWQVAEPPQPVAGAIDPNALADKPWGPLYATVAGELPLQDVPRVNADTAAVRFQIDVTAAGTAKLSFNTIDGLTLYLGETLAELKPETTLDLKVGVQSLTIIIDAAKASKPLRIELDDVAGSPARVRIVGGR